MLAGYIGMAVATTTNVLVTYSCNENMDKGFMAAYQGGQVLGFCLVGVALLVLEILIIGYKDNVVRGETADFEQIRY